MESVISAGVIGLSLGTQYALISIGFTLIFGIMGVVNFAHGGFYILGGYFAFTLTHTFGLPFPIALLLAALATGAVGTLRCLWNEAELWPHQPPRRDDARLESG